MGKRQRKANARLKQRQDEFDKLKPDASRKRPGSLNRRSKR